MARVLVAMSGGVDSSVAAALLREQGHELVGVTLHLWDAEGADKVGRCCAPEDREDARRTCDHLGIPHYVLDEREAFRTNVVEPFLDEYRRGRTPIPCVHCNRTVKLVMLDQLRGRFGCDALATGHYARIRNDNGRVSLLRGVDHDKDQSYFLFGVPVDTLSRMILPLGGLTKPETRAEGRRLGVPNAEKPDSQELCFVPDGNVADFVTRHRGPAAPARVVDEAGASVGAVDLAGVTVGQRKGLGLGGGGKPRYVLRILSDEVVVGEEAGLFAETLTARDVSWIGDAPTAPLEANVRIRYRHEPALASVTATEAGFTARFDAPQRAITPGQAVVVYRGDEVLGGGFIEKA